MRISALMVTRPERRVLMSAAIEAWLAQTHPNRELVIVVDQGPAAERAAAVASIEAFGRNDIRYTFPDRPLTLGALRNFSVSSATGEVICQWDDDDVHHPDRLAAQLSAMNEARSDACLLEDVLLWRQRSDTIYWTNWKATPTGGHPATLMCRRSAMPRYPESGPSADRHEDVALLELLRAAHDVHCLAGAPHLYVYVGHGANASGDEHIDMLVERLAISRGLLLKREANLRLAIAHAIPAGVTVAGSNGPAFTF